MRKLLISILLSVLFISLIQAKGDLGQHHIKEVKKSETLDNTNERIKKFLNPNTAIYNTFFQVLKKIKKGKYESTIEYNKRMENEKIDTYATMVIKTTTDYDPDKKIYKVKFDADYGPYSNTVQKSAKLSDYGEISSDFSSDHIPAPRATIKLEYQSDKYTKLAVHPDNLKKIIKDNNISTYMKPLPVFQSYYISIPADPEKAKILDKQQIMLKVGIELTDLKKSFYVEEKLTAEPAVITTYGFNCHIKEFIVYSDDTKEILFQYIE